MRVKPRLRCIVDISFGLRSVREGLCVDLGKVVEVGSHHAQVAVATSEDRVANIFELTGIDVVLLDAEVREALDLVLWLVLRGKEVLNTFDVVVTVDDVTFPLLSCTVEAESPGLFVVFDGHAVHLAVVGQRLPDERHDHRRLRTILDSRLPRCS